MECIARKYINDLIDSYKKEDIAVATICSHSSLQILYSAKKYGLKTIGIITADKKKTYDAFGASKPDEYIIVDSIKDFPDSELAARNALVIPHGSMVEYVGERIFNLKVPIFGNRKSLLWERNRTKMIEWLDMSGVKIPRTFKSKENIDRLCIVKFAGAKGGAGYTLVSSPDEFDNKVGKTDKEYLIQEFLVGVRAYPHFFFSTITENGYKTKHGHIEMLGIDRRIETSADEIYRSYSAGLKIEPSFTVIANEPIVIRESLLPKIFSYAEKIVEKSFDLFEGMIGPFCIELLIDNKMDIYVFEVSARIVAGTSIYINSSPYAIFSYNKPLSMSDRIMEEIINARKLNKLNEIFF